MKLGSSIRRRRGPAKGAKKGSVSPRRKGSDMTAGGVFRLVLLALAVVIGGGGIGYLVATIAIFPAPVVLDDFLTVPDVRGLSSTAASQQLREAGLQLGAIDSVRHPLVPRGEILGQSPLPRQLSVASAEVRITVSAGRDRRPVPDVVRLQADRASAVLQATGFSVVLDSIDAELPKGSVVSIDPAPGTEADLPREVLLRISLGPPMVEMPDLMGLQEEEALALLDLLGLIVPEVESRFRFGASQGAVLEQEPAAGIMLERGSAVRLVVGRRGIFPRNNPPDNPYDL